MFFLFESFVPFVVNMLLTFNFMSFMHFMVNSVCF